MPRQQRTMYLHTIDEKPAFFSTRSGQIVYADQLQHWEDRPAKAVLRASLRQIKRDQERTRAFRKKNRFKDDPPNKYGWVLVTVRM